MQITRQTDVSVHLTNEEVKDILRSHVLRQLHAEHHITLLPDGKVKNPGNIRVEVSEETTFSLEILDLE